MSLCFGRTLIFVSKKPMRFTVIQHRSVLALPERLSPSFILLEAVKPKFWIFLKNFIFNNNKKKITKPMCPIKINERFHLWTNKADESWKPHNAFCVAHPGHSRTWRIHHFMFCSWGKLRKHQVQVPRCCCQRASCLPAAVIWKSSSFEGWRKAQSL